MVLTRLCRTEFHYNSNPEVGYAATFIPVYLINNVIFYPSFFARRIFLRARCYLSRQSSISYPPLSDAVGGPTYRALVIFTVCVLLDFPLMLLTRV